MYQLFYDDLQDTLILIDGFTRPVQNTEVLSRIVLPDGRELRYEFDAFGNAVAARDAAGRTTRAEYGEDGFSEARLVYTRNFLASSGTLLILATAQEGDATAAVPRDQIESYVDANGVGTTYEYENGKLASIIYVDQSSETFTYDTAGTLDVTTNRRLQTINHDFNARGLLTTRTHSDGRTETFTYDEVGNPLTATNGDGTTSYEHDAAGRLTRVLYPGGRELNYTYDAAGNRTEISDGSGFAIRYEYDSLGRHRGDSRRDRRADRERTTYNAADRLARQDNANGTLTTYAYDAGGKVTSIVHRVQDDGVTSRFDYAYDALGRRTSATTLDGTTTYGYDAVGNLVSVMLPSGRRIEYAYDDVGNRIAVTDDGVTTDYVVDELGRTVLVGSTEREFDADGNLVLERTAGGDVTRYDYDDESRLVRISGPEGTTTYHYDAFGNRIAATRDGVRTEYLVDPTGLANVVAEFDAAGNVTTRYAHGAFGLVGRFDAAGDPAFYQFDSPGSTTALTGDGGAILNEYEYLPFGEIVSSTEAVANPFTYVGALGVMDEGGGLRFMRNRYYDAGVGSFTSLDPLRVPPTEPYGYAANDPIRNVDPLGLNAVSTTDIIDDAISRTRIIGDALGIVRVNDHTLPVAIVTDPDAFPDAPELPWFPPSVTENPLEVTEAVATVLYRNASRYFSRLERILIGGENVESYEGVDGIGHWEECSITSYDQARDAFLNGFPDCVGGRIVGLSSYDPNDIIGPAGVGPENHVRGESTFPYTIRFENLDTATAPAQTVTITTILDEDLDLDTFELGRFGFGNLSFDVPPGLDEDETRIQVREDLFVDVSAALDRELRIVEWTLSSIDPKTLDLPDPFGGFLPPNLNGSEGQGFVDFSIDPVGDLPTGTRIDAIARIVFDTNAPIDTPSIFNTIDVGPPSSRVEPLPAETFAETFVVSWSGADDGVGIAGYDVFLSRDGGQYTTLLNGTTDTSTSFTGEFGSTYEFYVAAFDFLGHREAAPLVADASTILVATSWHNASLPFDISGDGFISPIDVLLVINYLNSNNSPRIPDNQPPEFGMLDVNNDGFVTPIDALIPINYLNSGGAPEGEQATIQFGDWSDVLDAREDEEVLALLAADRERALNIAQLEER